MYIVEWCLEIQIRTERVIQMKRYNLTAGGMLGLINKDRALDNVPLGPNLRYLGASRVPLQTRG